MTISLFHRAGEDRVESATLAVLTRTDLTLVRDLLADAGGIGDDLRGLEVAPATMRSAARITARVDWSFEVVTTARAFDVEGPSRDRVRRLAGGLGAGDWLFVLTPDPPVPEWLTEPDGVSEQARGRLVWVSFAWFAASVREALSDPDRVIDARSHVLLAELVRLYDAEGLLHADDEADGGPVGAAAELAAPHEPSEPGVAPPAADRSVTTRRDDTLLVTDQGAWRTYLDHAAYVCAAEQRLPADVRHLAFHHHGRIMAVVPRIVQWHPRVALTVGAAQRMRDEGWDAAALTVESLVSAGRWGGDPVALALLTPAGDPATVRLAGPVDDPGTYEQRLTNLTALDRL